MQKKQKVIKDKDFPLYIVKDKNKNFLDEEQKIPYIACITVNENEAKEFINKKLLLENSNHFKLWCDLRNLKQDADSWLSYKKITQVENHYFYLKFKFKYHMIASILRIFYGCAPIGCSFDTLIETANALVQLPEEALSEIDKKLKENFESQE